MTDDELLDVRLRAIAGSDLFHPAVPDEFIDRVFAVMALAPQHQFQVLTKRPERMRAWMVANAGNIYGCSCKSPGAVAEHIPLPNVWLGTSVEDQETADRRIPPLLATPAAVRFLSCEPLLGPIDLGFIPLQPGHVWNCLCADIDPADRPCGGCAFGGGLHWVIVGGESGPHARPCDVEWIRSIVGQCQAAGVAVFVKQDSGPRSGQQGHIPDDLWLKDYPR